MIRQRTLPAVLRWLKQGSAQSLSINNNTRNYRSQQIERCCSSMEWVRRERNKKQRQFSISSTAWTKNEEVKSKRNNKVKTHRKLKIPEKHFEEYISEEDCWNGMKSGELISGSLIVNKEDFNYAFINSDDKGGQDIHIESEEMRNRALPGDIVAVQILPKDQWKKDQDKGENRESFGAKTGKVVYIIEKKHSRVATGFLRPFLNHQLGFALFSPVDSRLPRMMIPLEECPSDILSQPKDVEKTLFAAEITDWAVDSAFATGQMRKLKIPEKHFEEYISEEDCWNGMKSGELISGSLRVNEKDFNYAFINSDDKGGRDIHIESEEMRNRALPGDIVAVQILPKDQWKKGQDKGENRESFVAKTGKVVYIIEKKHSRVAAGFLRPFLKHQLGFALFSPVDSRLPRMMIPLEECPSDFLSRPKDVEKTLFVAKITDWAVDSAFATGQMLRTLGEAGLIEPETGAILMELAIDSSDFSDDVNRCLPDGETWSITDEELGKRKDLRLECIFSIDPATARDLDDALSCKKIGDDLFEVGVHIADVSHFIEEGSVLDAVAKQRATSVYLRQKVIPMLPNVLCEQLCSLNSGVDRLAYSVIWNLNADGTIVSEWFGRSVIRSCVQLSYDHAQQMIECSSEDLSEGDFPSITGNFSLSDISSVVKHLHGIASRLRKGRFESGALQIEQTKIAFTLDNEEGTPNGCHAYEYKASNKLIEEFMLLANMAVARKIFQHNPSNAILRHHPPPDQQLMAPALEVLKDMNILNMTNEVHFKKSLNKVLAAKSSELSEQMVAALNLQCVNAFQLALYYCADGKSQPHYALNVPIYTHFTSPIRRYPDVLVHRCLTASLDKTFKTNSNVKDLEAITDHCNDKRYAAKGADDRSTMLFLAVFLRECGPLREHGVVVKVLDRAVDVLALSLGYVIRVHCDQLSLLKQEHKTEPTEQLTLYWKQREPVVLEKSESDDSLIQGERMEGVIEQKLSIFSPVDIVVSAKPVEKWRSGTKLAAILVNPYDVDQYPELGL